MEREAADTGQSIPTCRYRVWPQSRMEEWRSNAAVGGRGCSYQALPVLSSDSCTLKVNSTVRTW